MRADRPAVSDFDQLYAAHFGNLTVQLYLYFGDLQEAHDVVQEAFCRAYARWGAISGYEDPVGCVRRVAWNQAVSRCGVPGRCCASCAGRPGSSRRSRGPARSGSR